MAQLQSTVVTGSLYISGSDPKVGIGTTSPEVSLQVETLNGGGAIQIGRDTGANEYQYLNFGGNAAGDAAWQIGKNLNSDNSIGPAKGFYLYDLASSTSRLVVDTSGNVGIGTKDPQRPLHVSGSTSTGENAPLVYLQHSFTGDFGFGLGIGRNNQSAVSALVLGADSSNDGIIATNNGELRIGRMQSTTLNEYIRIDTSGNVGIGTTSPDTKLEIVGADPILTIRDSSTSLASAKAFLRLAESGASDTLNRYVQVALSGSALGTNLTFDLDGNEKMRINESGNVGIGTTEPGSILEIAGTTPTLTIDDTRAGSWISGDKLGTVSFRTSDGSAAGAREIGFIHIENEQAGSNTTMSGAMIFGSSAYNAAATERMRLDSNGRLFLGTATVAAANAAADDFVIKGEGAAVGMTISNSNSAGTGTIFFGDADGSAVAGFRYNHNTGDMAISAEDNITITADRVGIGVLSPDDKLHVGGNISITDSSPEITLETTSATHFNWQIAAQENVDGALEFSVGSQDEDASNDTFSPLMIIKNTGYVGIGVNNPPQKLTVDGTISGSSDLSIDGDSVFDGTVGYNEFNSGFGGTGWRIDSSANAEFQNLTVRGTFSVYELLAQQIRATNGSLLVATSGKVQDVDGTTLLFDSGSGYGHGFVAGDVLISQRLNPVAGVIERTFITVDSVANTGSLVYTDASGSPSTPQPGQEFVRIGHTSNANRQGHIYLTADDTYAPYIGVRDGLSGSAQFEGGESIEKVRVGRLDGITSSTFGSLSGYGFWAKGDAYLEGGISATFGNIGGFGISADAIFGDNFFLSGSATGNEFFISSPKFNIKANGDVTGSQVLFTGGDIGGFSISQDALSGDNFYLSGSATGNEFFISASNFNVKANGDVTASNADITGKITATSGEIGGFGISADAIFGDNFYLSGSATGNEFFISSSKFNVKANGDVTASNADITGKISATSGEIGGWTINDGDLSSTNITLSSDNESIALGSPTPGNLTSDGIFLSGSGEFNFQVVDSGDDKEYIRQSGGVLDVRASKFFIGNETTQFISGADSNIEISSSQFHLDPNNNILVIGSDAVINADVTANSIRTPATIGGAPSTVANASSSIDSNGFAKFVSASIGGWNVTSEAIYKEVGDVFNILGKPDNISGAWSTTWENGLTVGKNGANRLWISGDETGNHYEMAIYSASQYLVRLGTNENKIAGWTIDKNSIFSGTKDTSEYSTSGITLSSAGSIHTPSFYVSTAGDAFFKGTLSAPDGNIGGFTIADSQLHTLNKSTFSSNAAGVYIGTDGIALGTNSPFNVNANGEVTASNFLFEGGKITGDVSFQAPLDGSTVVYFDDFSIYPTVTDVTSSGDAPKIDGSGQGYYPYQNNGELSLETGEGELFGKAFKIGNNSGNDYSWFSGNRLIPFNENSLYEMEIRIKETAGIGTHYVGITAYSKNGTTKVNATGANSHSSQHYFVLSNASIGSEFTTYRGYFKGTSSSGNGGLHNSKDDPGTVHVNALNGYFSPMFIAQYQNDPGITYVDYIKITEFNVGGSSTVISGDTIKTGTIKSTNLTATLGTQLALDDGEMRIGGTGAYTSNNGILLDGPNAQFAVGNAGGSYIRFNHTANKIEINTDNFDIDSSGNVTVTGTVNANAGNFTSTVTIGDGSTTGSLEVGTSSDKIVIQGTNNSDSTKVYAGAGNFNSVDTGFYLDADGRFSLKDKLLVDLTGNLSVSGSLNTENGNIGGWVIDDGSLVGNDGAIVLDANNSSVILDDGSNRLDMRTGPITTITSSVTVYSGGNSNMLGVNNVFSSGFLDESGESNIAGSYNTFTIPEDGTYTGVIDISQATTSITPSASPAAQGGVQLYTGIRIRRGSTTGTIVYDSKFSALTWDTGQGTQSSTSTKTKTATIVNSGNNTYYVRRYYELSGIISQGTLTIDARAYIPSSETLSSGQDIVEVATGGIQVANSSTGFVRMQKGASYKLDIYGNWRVQNGINAARIPIIDSNEDGILLGLGGGGDFFMAPIDGGTNIFTKELYYDKDITRWRTDSDFQVGQNLTVSNNLNVSGTKNFKIQHPLKDDSYLIHTAIEGPNIDLLYRGTSKLENGLSIVNLDTESRMTNGTFEALTTNVQCFTSNETSWSQVRGKVEGNILTIECQNTSSTDTISWMVVAQRSDESLLNSGGIDDNGKLIVEEVKSNSNDSKVKSR